MNTKNALIVPFASAMLALFLSGCGYHGGSLMHSQIKTMAVGRFTNNTREPQLSARLRSRIGENILRDGSVRLADMESADSYLVGTIDEIVSKTLSTSLQRSDADADTSDDEYQTSIYRVQVIVSYELRVPGYQSPLVPKQTVTGQADFSRLPDLSIARRDALKIALNDAAEKLVHSVTEAW
ncbi:MAG: hypothetical protein KAI66_09245 [Lentisphaeria bacterium]|nr:hypothetical protein [Lentisphaeria bacterium]